MTDPADDQAHPTDHQAAFFRVYPAVMLPLFIGVVDQTIVATSLHAIAASLGDFDLIVWVMVAHLITSAISAPVYGRLGDAFGRRRLLVVALAITLLGSLMCAFAWSMPMLIAARIVQGLGGGGLIGLTQAIIGQSLPPRARARYQGFLSFVAVSANMFGPVVGGLLTEQFGWRSIFLINVPLGLLAILLTVRLPPRTGPRQTFRLDWPGMLALSVAITALLIFLERVQGAVPGDDATLAVLGGVFLAAMALFGLREVRGSDPLIPLPILRNPSILCADGLAFCQGAVVVCLITFTPLYLRIAHDMNAGEIGLHIIPMTCGVGIGAVAIGQLAGRTGRTAIFPSIGMTAATVIIVGLAIFLNNLAPIWIATCLGVTALFLGMVMPIVQVTVLEEASSSMFGSATATVQLMRMLGASVGAATVGVVLFATVFAGGAEAFDYMQDMLHGEASPALPTGHEAATRNFVLGAFTSVYLMIAVFTGIGSLLAWLMPRRSL